MMSDLIIEALKQRNRTMRIVGKRVRLTRDHMELMQIPQRFWSVTFDQVADGEVRERLRRYLRDMDEMLDRGEGLLLWGPNGHGKTSIAVLAAMEARRRGASVLFVQADDLRVASIDGTEFSDDKTLVQRAREVDFLVIDDLGKEHSGKGSEYGERFFENLIRYRSAQRRTTTVTTNMTPTGDEERTLAKRYLASMIDVMKEVMHPMNVECRNLRDDARDNLTERLAV